MNIKNITKANIKHDPNMEAIFFAAAKKLGVKTLSEQDKKRTIAECKSGNIDLGIDKV
jgi:hypothetical protein